MDRLGDHTEVVDVYFDQAVSSFEKIFLHFLNARDHSTKTSCQYKSLVLCHDHHQFGESS